VPQSNQSTAHAISPDSGLPWAEEGPWQVADDLYRLPLPLPNDGLRAVNVYVLTGDEGLTLIDGGWAIQESRATLERGLRALGHDIRDIRQFLVTHLHRDHFSLASCLGKEFAVPVALGRGDQPALTLLNGNPADFDAAVLASITAGGAPGLAGAVQEGPARDLDEWRLPRPMA
jgi:glyoxylase-like metal-dependent hydrolase (beta-lactamase superfamily II)